jgi:hypothetical protein
MFDHQNHAAGGGNGSIMVEMFVCLCLASQKSSEREFFVPARTDLGVKYFYSLSVNYKNPSPAVGNDSQNGIHCHRQTTIIYRLTKYKATNNV